MRIASASRASARVQHGIAVPQLRRGDDVDRYTRNAFDEHFTDHAGIRRRAAAGDDDPVDVPRALGGQLQLR
jgi:hypothetical protein